MSLGKQAKILSKAQTDGILGYLEKTRSPIRNRTIFLLSFKAGLRAKEIANLTWDMVTSSDESVGPSIHLRDEASKGRSGRTIPINPELHRALVSLKISMPRNLKSNFVITTERSSRTSPQAIVNLFRHWYKNLSLNGCSSHSGRRTFITNAARKISTVGGSLRDVQILAGHTNLRTTQTYIDQNNDAQQRIVGLI